MFLKETEDMRLPHVRFVPLAHFALQESSAGIACGFHDPKHEFPLSTALDTNAQLISPTAPELEHSGTLPSTARPPQLI